MGQRLTTLEVRQRETPRGFQIGEGSGTSHHMPEREAIPIMASHAPTRPTMPTFLAEDIGAAAQWESKVDPGQMDAYIAEYLTRGPTIRDLISFRDYVQLQRDGRPRDHHRGHRHHHDDHRAASRFHLPTFDGSSNSSAKFRVEKLDIYFQLNQMLQSEAIKVHCTWRMRAHRIAGSLRLHLV